MKTRCDYDQLQAELQIVEKATGLYLADENVDAENTEQTPESDEYWDAMYRSATMAAGQRAENEGHDINALLGRVIY